MVMISLRSMTLICSAMAAVLLIASVAVRISDAAPAKIPQGARLYQKHCASCHGKTGQGVKGEYSKALMGDMYIPRLTRFIEKEMPEDKPKTVTGDNAKRVAQYIYDSFYSPVAAARHRPPRIEMARLTVRQYRNTIADLIGSFNPAVRIDDKRGLEGQYYKSRALDRDRVIKRIDPVVKFNLGPSFPDRGKFDPKGFSISWTGSLLAPDTGKYEFIIHTDQSMKFWLNDPVEPLIDAYVRSGDKKEHRVSMFLLGGRAYPITLEFSSYRQGVGKSDKRQGDIKIVPAFIELHWKRPSGIAKVIPSRHLSPLKVPKSLALATPFPPDDSSVGYERGTSISKAWDEATTTAAIETAGYVIDNLQELTGARKKDPDRNKKLVDFCRRFVERAFRRPLDDPQRELFIDRQFARAPDLESAVKRVVILTLKSPRFLYLKGRSAKADGYDIASRLSFSLWDSLPDKQLLDAAKTGRLSSRQQVAQQAKRMIDDPRTRSKIRQFLHHWLLIDDMPKLEKDRKRYPQFDELMALDLRTSLDLFLDEVIWSDPSDYRQLLTSDNLYLNGRLAKFYGLDLPTDVPFQKLDVKKGEHAGVLTHPYLMARFAYLDTSSPIHRGVFLARSVLGRTLKPPPDAFSPTDPDLHPKMTTRQRVTLQTKSTACMSCHGMINSLGFTLENFDAVGRYRTKENGQTIDATGKYEMASGKKQTFKGARDLAKFLVGSDQAHRAFVLQLFHHLVKQPIFAYGPNMPDELRKSFADHKFNVRKLMVEIALTSAWPKLGSKPSLLRQKE